MFNKPTLFPKSGPDVASTSPVSAPRGGRLVPGTGASSGIASANEGASTTRESPLASTSSALASASAAEAKPLATSGDSHLIVGPNVKLKGAEILDCDTLVVEGTVEAKMDSRVIRIAEKGFFTGTVGIDVAEIHGRFEGELTARSQLIIHSTGRVSGKIRYGKIFIEEGGEISGDIKAVDASAAPAPAAVAVQLVQTNSQSGSEAAFS
ncbi:MAG: polymer-forming cytoskeletal protein [Zoogloeaceae bacterium]|nr:polymer-forming cytoskeletal protein [Zoogloeaceae bacterium]